MTTQEGLEAGTEGILDRCSVAQLRELMRIGLPPNGRATSLPAELGDVSELAPLLTDYLPEESESGEALLEAVTGVDSPLEVLRQMKELAKQLVENAPSARHRNAGRILYHAAIAAAYGRHGENLSTLPILPRVPLYEDLAAVLAGEALGAVFLAAVERAAKDA